MNRKITICRAEKQELKTILDIQRLAFQREAEEYNALLDLKKSRQKIMDLSIWKNKE